MFILFAYYVAPLSSGALIHNFKMNGNSFIKCFFNIIFDMRESSLSILVISKSHDLVMSLNRMIMLCERYDSRMLWSKFGWTAFSDVIAQCWSIVQKIHIISSSPVPYWICFFFLLQASLCLLYLLLKTMIINDLSASKLVSFCHIFSVLSRDVLPCFVMKNDLILF